MHPASQSWYATLFAAKGLSRCDAGALDIPCVAIAPAVGRLFKNTVFHGKLTSKVDSRRTRAGGERALGCGVGWDAAIV